MPAADLGDFLPEVLYSLNTWRGHVWTLPVGAYAQGIMYRTDVFEEAGIDPLPATTADAEDWTWDDYFGIVDQLNGMEMDGTTFYGTTLIGAQPVPVVHMYTQLSASYGTRWFTQFPEAPWDFTPTIDSAENLAAMQDWKRLYEMSPPESINYLWFDAGTRFSQGDIALFYHWTPYFYLVNNEGYLSGQPSPGGRQVPDRGAAHQGTGWRPGREPWWLGARHAIDGGQPGCLLAVHQLGDRRRRTKGHGPGRREGQSVCRLQP